MRRYACVRQRDETDCGAACLATVCRAFNSTQALGRIRALAGTDKMGTSAFGMVTAAEKLGFSARGVRGTMNSLLQADNIPLPAIAHMITAERMLHYVVIHRIRKHMLTVADPALGIKTVSADEFAKHWSGVLILLAPAADGLLQGPGEDSAPRRFLGLLRGQGNFLALLTVASVIITAIGIVTAFYFKVIIDQVVPGHLWRTLTTISFAIIALYVVSGLLNAARYQLVLHLQQRINIPLVLGYYNHVMGLPMSFYGTRRVGEIITRFSDAGKIQQALTGATVTVFVDWQPGDQLQAGETVFRVVPPVDPTRIDAAVPAHLVAALRPDAVIPCASPNDPAGAPTRLSCRIDRVPPTYDTTPGGDPYYAITLVVDPDSDLAGYGAALPPGLPITLTVPARESSALRWLAEKIGLAKPPA